MKNKQKKILLLSMTMLISLASFTQSTYQPALQKGSTMVGGGMALSFGNAVIKYSGYYGSDESEEGYSSFSFTPTVGSFVSNGMVVGLIADWTSTTYKDKDADSKSTSTQYSFGPALRYYASNGFFVQGDISFGKMIEKYSYDDESEQEDTNLLKWKLGIGYAFFLNDHVSVEPSFMYRKTTAKFEDDETEFEGKLGEFVIGVGLNIFLHKSSQ